MMLMNPLYADANLQITYEGSQKLTHLIYEDEPIPLYQKGYRYYAHYLKAGKYQVYSEDEYITSFSMNEHHLQKGMKFTYIQPSKKKLKYSFPYALVMFCGLSIIFFGFLGYLWIKIFPRDCFECYNVDGDEYEKKNNVGNGLT